MDYETLETVMNSPYAITGAVAVATGVISSVIGYISGRSNSKARVELAKCQRDLGVSRAESDKAQYEFQRQDALASVERRRIEIEDGENEHRRDLETRTKEREWKLEDEERAHKRELENYERKMQEEKLRLDNRVAVASQLAELRGDFQDYLHRCTEAQTVNSASPEYLEGREEYRMKLVEKLIEYTEDDAGDIFSSDFSIDDGDKEKIESLLDLRYPLPKTKIPEMPDHLHKLIVMLTSTQ